MNPYPSLQGALWNGNQQLATKNQLISSITGLYTDLQDLSGFDFNNITSSTIRVSTLYAGNMDISGINFDASGILFAPYVSSSYGLFNVTNVSVMQLQFKPTFTGNIEVSFNLGLGEAIGGFLAGLGAAVGGGLIAVGTGAGLAIQGAEQGIATIIAGRPQNYITNNTYETINFTSQLQVSTLGNAAPAYSSIFRTVSSISANEVPGPEMFTSTIFYPGQICIRSVSDPFNLITGNSNINTSTIQSFGQWVPLEGLEPTNIEAFSISTTNLQASNSYIELLQVQDIQGYSGVFSNAGFAQSASLNYQAPLNFQLGATNMASIEGDLNNLYLYNQQNFIFSRGTVPNQENASLYMGANANESLLNISTINSIGGIKTVDFYASTITAENLNVVSTFFITSTSFENVTSTNILNVDTLLAQEASIASFVSSFSFTTPVGNPTSPFDINRTNSYISTSYNSISSLTQNILNYNLTAQIQERTSFSPFNAQAETYTVSPTNVEQWASTMIICNPGADIGGQLAMTYPSSFFTVPMTGQFDLTVDMTTQPFSFGLVQYTGQVPGDGYNILIPFIPPTTGFFQTYRVTCGTNGVWSAVTPAPPPPITINSNVFSIYQDINDTYITATDRLHLQAGDIMFDGTLNLANVNLDTLNVDYLNVQTLANINVMSTLSIATGQPTAQISQFWTSNYSPASMLSSVTTQLSSVLLHSVFQPVINRPVITLNPGGNNDITLTKLGTWLYNGTSNTTSNYAFGTFVIYPPDNFFKIYTDNNGFGLSSNVGQVVNLSNASATQFMSLYIGFPSPAINIPANSAVSVAWNGVTGLWSQITYAPWTPVTSNSIVELQQNYNMFTIVSPSTIMNSNVTIGGTLSLRGKTITTFIMTWNHTIGFASQHDYGTQDVQDGYGNSYNVADWVMKFSVLQIELNSVAYAMNSFSMRPNTDVNGNYTVSWDTYFTTTMATSFNIMYWLDITMYPREMINATPPKNW